MRSLKFLAVLLFLCVSCLEPYDPAVNEEQIDALVVDGSLDIEGKATVKLTRALPLLKFANAPLETGATVSIESNDGEKINLTETEPGVYSASNLAVNFQSSYTLNIIRSNGSVYKSNEVKIYKTPDIENVFFAAAPTGDAIDFRVNSKDTNPDATGFYAYECIETYEYTAQYFSRFKRIDGVPVLRKKGEFVDTCWHELPVPMTLVSTKRLTENTISGHNVTTINLKSQKISRRYSLLVRQRSISEDEYNYRRLLDKTSNEQGGVFAEIPGSVVSNVRNVDDPNEVVLGYFRAHEMKEKRFFISHQTLPRNLQLPLDPEQCDLETSCPVGVKPTGPNQCVEILQLSDSKIIITSFAVQNNTVYVFSTNECGDCTKKGGKTMPPDYWY